MSEQTPIEIRTDNYFAAFPHWVLDKKLSSGAIHLYLALLSFANWETRMGRPSRQTLSDLMGCSIKTVDRAKDELVQNGLLRYERRPNKSNYYTVITANPHSDKNDTTNSGSDKNDIPRGDKNDIRTRINNNNKDAAPNGAAVPKLVALYLDNFVGEFRPNPAELGKNIKRLIEQGHKPERLAELIPGIAMTGRKVTAGTLGFEASQQAPEPVRATPTPPPYVAQERPDRAPMPMNMRELVKQAAEKAKLPD